MSNDSPSASVPSLATSAFMVSDQASYSSSDSEEVASLPSESTTSSELSDLDSEYSDAEEEWRESIEQLELLLTMVLVPFVGKYFGRKCAYWGWNRFMEWKYPIESVASNRSFFGNSGSVKTSASL